MERIATFWHKLIYSLAILSLVIPLQMSGWVAITLGVGPIGPAALIGHVPLVLLVMYRIYFVAQTPGTLNAWVDSAFTMFLRRLGLLLMVVGIAVAALRFATGPLMRMMRPNPSESGIEFYIVGLFMTLVGSTATWGVLLFEFSRLLGFERRSHDSPTADSI